MRQGGARNGIGFASSAAPRSYLLPETASELLKY